MSLSVPVALGERSYRVQVGDGALDALAATIGERAAAARVAVVTDSRVEALHRARLEAALPQPAAGWIAVPPGEGAKSFAGLADVVDRLLALGLGRSDLVLAFGGGVVGDLAGFAAAILKRGTGLVQLPTTLLAMVDSSVGGKTGINTAAGKNLVGAFHQPLAVIADTALLGTLPLRERQAGFAEVVKYGLIDDPAFFDWCAAAGPAVLALEPAAIAHAVATSVAAKARVVAADEREDRDIRALLNLGHSFGHALEAETGFGDRLLHGEAVAIGMVLAHCFSAARGLAPAADAERVRALFDAVGMRTHPRQAGIGAGAAGRLVGHLAHDKKRDSSGIPLILTRGIGRAFVARGIALAEVEAFLDAILAEG